MSTKCPQCGTENQDNAKFCNECGYRFPQQNVCPSCGLPVQPGIKFCSNCGHSFVAKTAPQPVHAAAPRQQSSAPQAAPVTPHQPTPAAPTPQSASTVHAQPQSPVSQPTREAHTQQQPPCSPSYSGDSYAVFPCPAGTTDSTETCVSEIA